MRTDKADVITDEERQAIREAADAYALNNDDADCERIERVLRGLLERTDNRREPQGSPGEHAAIGGSSVAIATCDNDRPEAIATCETDRPEAIDHTAVR